LSGARACAAREPAGRAGRARPARPQAGAVRATGSVSAFGLLAAGVLLAGAAAGGPADVVEAEARCAAAVCDFTVTVRHADEGWDHYADAWQVVATDGSVIATRVLRHPHVDEQPFTRRLRGVPVPPGTGRVRIRARDSLHGLGGREVVIELGPRGAAEGEPRDGKEASG